MDTLCLVTLSKAEGAIGFDTCRNALEDCLKTILNTVTTYCFNRNAYFTIHLPPFLGRHAV